jgi:hypothetical protein
MEFPVVGWGKVNNYEKEVAEADYPTDQAITCKAGSQFFAT